MNEDLNQKRREIVDFVLAHIRRNKLRVGTKLPSAAELCERFGVNRSIVRTALSQLALQGKIYTEQGRGSFVAATPPGVMFEHTNKLGFSEILRGTGQDYSSRLIRCVRIEAPANLCRVFSLGENERVYHIELLRCLKNSPLAVCNSYIPEKLAPGIDGFIAESQSVNEILQSQYGLEHPYCESVAVTAVISSTRDIRLLEVGELVPILQITHVFSTREMGPVEYYVVRARSDRFKFHMSF
jgi:GntR family transcriptional regulator